MTTAHADALSNRTDRATARLAQRARLDTIHGGAAAVLLERRLKSRGSPVGFAGVVAAVYGASTGRHHPELEAWECPECGTAHLGQTAALQCCNSHDQ